MRTCTVCNETKELSEYHHRPYKGVLRPISWCRACQKVKHAANYAKNRDRIRAKQAEYSRTVRPWVELQKKYRAGWMEFLPTQKKLECERCGYNKDFVALEFHHVNPTEKDFNIGKAMQSKPTAKAKEEVRKELDKCIVLCANCHREHHNGGGDSLL